MCEVLLLTPQLPYPPHQGTSLRNLHIVKGLSRRNRITLLSFLEHDRRAGPETMGPLPDLCRQIVTIPAPPRRSSTQRLWQMATTRKPDMALRLHSHRFEITLRRLLSEKLFAVVQIEGIELAWTIEPIRAICPDVKLVFDAHNAESVLQERSMQADLGNFRRWPAAAYSWVQSRRLRQLEAWIGEEVDWVTAVSQSDKDSLAAQMTESQVPITIIPNSIDVSQYEGDTEAADFLSTNLYSYDVIFTGKMDYRPNVDAVLWFADEVWPKIVAHMPETKWAIVGQRVHARLERVRDLPGVTFTGWVEHIQPYLVGAKVFIMPFRVGSGTRLKLIEALAARKAVVSTSMGVEGYPVQNGTELLLADTAKDMAEAVVKLLADPELRIRLGTTGCGFAQQYDWRKITTKFDEVYSALGE